MPTASTIYEVPLIQESSGLGAYIATPPRPAAPRRSAGVDRPGPPDQDRAKRRQGRPHRQVRRPARCLHERDRVAHPRRSRPRHQRRGRLGQLRDRHAGRAGPRAAQGPGRRRARRLRAARRRGQDHGGPLRARARRPVPWALLRPPYGRDRGVAQPARPAGRQLDRDQPRDDRAGHRPDAGPEGRRDGRHDAARALAVPAGGGYPRRRCLRRGDRLRAPPAPVRGQQCLPRPAGRGRPDRQRRLAGRPPRRDHGAARPPLSTSASSSTRSSRAARPGPTRCSGTSSPPSSRPSAEGAQRSLPLEGTEPVTRPPLRELASVYGNDD